MSRRRDIHFYGTLTDLTPGLRSIEQRRSLQYVLHRAYDTRAVPVLGSAFEIVDLGHASGRRSDQYYVFPREARVRVERIVEIPRLRPGWRRDLACGLSQLGIRLPGGRIRFEVYPTQNPDCIEFEPGGMHDDSILLAGRIALPPESAGTARHLYGEFCRGVLRGFKQIRSSMVGPEAEALLYSGARLAQDVEASGEFDLREA